MKEAKLSKKIHKFLNRTIGAASKQQGSKIKMNPKMVRAASKRRTQRTCERSSDDDDDAEDSESDPQQSSSKSPSKTRGKDDASLEDTEDDEGSHS